MRRVIGFLGSLAVGLMLTAAGLVLDARSLVYSGIIVFAAMAALWLWAWARPIEVAVAPGEPSYKHLLDHTPPSELLDEDGKALFYLRRARENADIARSYKGKASAQICRDAFHELEFAMQHVNKRFGIKPLNFHKAANIPHIGRMTAYIAFVDRILPLLGTGKVEEAKEKASSFNWRWGS